MTTDKRPNFELSVDTRLLYQRLKETHIGDQVSYDELSELIGRDVRNGAHSNLQSARNRCMKHDGIVFGTIRTVGLKRLNDTEIVETAEEQINRIRRASRRAAKTLAQVRDFAAMPEEAQTKHNASLSLFGAVAKITQTSQVQKLEKHVGEAQKQLPLAKTLEFFAGT